MSAGYPIVFPIFRKCLFPPIVGFSIEFLPYSCPPMGQSYLFIRLSLSPIFPSLFPRQLSSFGSKTWQFHSMTALLPMPSTRAHDGDIVVRLGSSVVIDPVLTQHCLEGVLLLNLYLLLPLLTSCTNGYDSSLINGRNCHTRWMPSTCPDGDHRRIADPSGMEIPVPPTTWRDLRYSPSVVLSKR